MSRHHATALLSMRSRAAIPEALRVAVVADRTVRRVPRVELLAAARLAAEHGLELAHLTLRDQRLTLGVRDMKRSGTGGVAPFGTKAFVSP